MIPKEFQQLRDNSSVIVLLMILYYYSDIIMCKLIQNVNFAWNVMNKGDTWNLNYLHHLEFKFPAKLIHDTGARGEVGESWLTDLLLLPVNTELLLLILHSQSGLKIKLHSPRPCLIKSIGKSQNLAQRHPAQEYLTENKNIQIVKQTFIFHLEHLKSSYFQFNSNITYDKVGLSYNWDS